MGLPNSVKIQQQAIRDRLAGINSTMAANASLEQSEEVQKENAKLQREAEFIQQRVIEANTGEIINHINALLGDARSLVEKYIPFRTDSDDPVNMSMSAESKAAEVCNSMLTVEQTHKLIKFMVEDQGRFEPEINMDITTPTGKINNIVHMKNVIEDNLSWPQFDQSLTDQQRAYLMNAVDLANSYITENGSPSAEADYISFVTAQQNG